MSGSTGLNENAGDGIFSPLHTHLLGDDPQIRAVNALLRKLAQTNLTIFISGETGTGKDIVAVLAHKLAERAKKPFVKINCPSIPEDVLESELFGHERGAFTGAHTSRPGRLELARGGTVFLDEICETTLRFQSRLIQVLDGEPFMRVGGTRPIPMTARVVAASNMTLDNAVAQGRLRKDIAFRLREAVIHLPSLRERPADVPLLAEHFNYHACKQSGVPYEKLDPEVIRHLKGLRWDGNVRELAAWVREYAATGTHGSLKRKESGTGAGAASDTRKGNNGPTNGGRKFMALSEVSRLAAEEAERALIEDTLRYTRWNRRKAAELLDTSYSSLLRRIAKYNLGQ